MLKVCFCICYILCKSIFQRFFPSEFGNDVDHVHAVEPAKSVFAAKASIRRAVEAEGSPTRIYCPTSLLVVSCQLLDRLGLQAFQ